MQSTFLISANFFPLKNCVEKYFFFAKNLLFYREKKLQYEILQNNEYK